jgi:hypothetical protein
VVERVYEGGIREPAQVVSDGDPAIAGAIELVYGAQVPHQLCQFHLLQEYRRNLEIVGWAEAKALLRRQDWVQRPATYPSIPYLSLVVCIIYIIYR